MTLGGAGDFAGEVAPSAREEPGDTTAAGAGGGAPAERLDTTSARAGCTGCGGAMDSIVESEPVSVALEPRRAAGAAAGEAAGTIM
jgi:hypothetical protein